MDDDRRSNVGGAESGVDASPGPGDVGEASGRELELRAKSLRARDTDNVPGRSAPAKEAEGSDVDRRP
jgi:hypothetical protein